MKKCAACKRPGRLVECSECPRSWHLVCAGLKKTPPGHWACPKCCEARAIRRAEDRKTQEERDNDAAVVSVLSIVLKHILCFVSGEEVYITQHTTCSREVA